MKKIIFNKHSLLIMAIVIFMFIYFLLGRSQMADDGFQYEGFAESLAHGKLDFKSFYGFQGLSFFAVPIYWLTKSSISIIIASIIFALLSAPLSYLVGRDLFKSKKAGIYSLILFLLMPYPYVTLMRGFQEAALLFFIYLIIYASINKKLWAPVVWAVGAIVKPFSLVLAPLFIGDFLSKKKVKWFLLASIIGFLYLGANYYQVGHFVNNAAIGSYQGNFNPNDVPSLEKSFTLGAKGFLRVAANLLLSSRKIMISPLIIIIGSLFLVFSKFKKKNITNLDNKVILSIALNIILVGIMTFTFSKYLLPMVVLIALFSIPVLISNKWLMLFVFIDSYFVFKPIYDYFGRNYWSSELIYFLPFFYALIIFFVYEFIFKKFDFNTNS